MIATATQSPIADWMAQRCERAMTPGSVVVHAPVAAFQAPGGGEIQLFQTARHLEELGQTIRPFVPWRDRLEDARLLHLFGMSREGLDLARVARVRGIPVVLSPICWFEPGALKALARSPMKGALDVSKWGLRRAFPRLPGWRRELLSMADRILPNSGAEATQLVRLFGVSRSGVPVGPTSVGPSREGPTEVGPTGRDRDSRQENTLRVIPNGVDPRFSETDPDAFRDQFGDEPFVLYAGRVEPRKNVLGLIRSMRGMGRMLVVIGDVVPGHEGYGEACRREGNGFLRWLPRIEHDDPMLASAYAAARVFALPSWFETPGLAALEAALAGCAVVITPNGCTREYFGDSAHYARPDHWASIRNAIERAWDAGPDAGLARRVAERYPWSEVARQTAEVYDEIAA